MGEEVMMAKSCVPMSTCSVQFGENRIVYKAEQHSLSLERNKWAGTTLQKG